MKKLFFAMLALCAMAVSFTSCEKQADPAKEPIAGKTYMDSDETGTAYIKVVFHMNHKATMSVKMELTPQPVVQDLLVWRMNADAKTFQIIWADNAYNTQTREPVGGTIAYEGVYNAEAKQVVLIAPGTQGAEQYTLTEVK